MVTARAIADCGMGIRIGPIGRIRPIRPIGVADSEGRRLLAFAALFVSGDAGATGVLYLSPASPR